MAYSGDITGPWNGQQCQDSAALEPTDGAVQYPVMPLQALYIEPALRTPLSPPSPLPATQQDQNQSQHTRPKQQKEIRHSAQKRRLFLHQQSQLSGQSLDAYGHLVPLAPPSISSNPDHHLYPSYQFMDHSIAAAVRQQHHELQQDGYKAPASPLSQQPRSIPPHSSSASGTRPPPVQSHLRFLAQAKAWTARQHLSGSSRQKSKAPTSYPSSSLGQDAPPPPSSSPPSGRPAHHRSLAYAKHHLDTHPPSHPAIFHLPLLRPASTIGPNETNTLVTQHKTSKRSRETSPDTDKPPHTPHRRDTNDTAHAHKRRRTSQNSRRTAKPSLWPYGRDAPATVLLNQPPYLDFVSEILAQADVKRDQQSTLPLHQYDSDVSWPAWMAAYLQTSSLRRAWASPARSLQQAMHEPGSPQTSFTRIPPSEPPDPAILSACMDKYTLYVHTVYPILPPGRQRSIVADFLDRSPHPVENTDDHAQARIQLAVELLVLALGSIYWLKSDAVVFESGPDYYTRAKVILEAIADDSERGSEGRNDNFSNMSSRSDGIPNQTGRVEELQEQGSTPRQPSSSQKATVVAATSSPVPTMDLARAHLIAALFCGQLAWLQEAALHVRSAADAIHRMLLRLGATTTTSGSSHGLFGSKAACDLTGYEQQLVVLYWICVQLEFEFNSDAGQPPSALLRYQSAVPAPDFDAWRASAAVAPPTEPGAVGGPLRPPLDTAKDFEAQVVLHGYRNRIYQEAFVNGQDNWPESSYNVAPAVAELTMHFGSFAIAADANLPAACKSILKARAHFAYWEIRAFAALHGFLRPGADLSATDATEAVRGLIGVISAHQGMQNGFNLFLPNAFGVAMAQCRYLLLLFAASRLPLAVAPLVDDGMLADLIDGTLASLDNVAGPFGVVEAARRVLAVLKGRLAFQPVPGLDPGLDHRYAAGALGAHAPPVLAAAAPIVPSAPGPSPHHTGHTGHTELSVFCPSFSDAPDMTTASSASSSFQSIPTPSTPPPHPHAMLPSGFASPFASPVSTAFSPSPSGSFSAYYMASPFATGKAPLKQPAPFSIPGVPLYTLQSTPKPMLQVMASPAVNMDNLAVELGLDKSR